MGPDVAIAEVDGVDMSSNLDQRDEKVSRFAVDDVVNRVEVDVDNDGDGEKSGERGIRQVTVSQVRL